MHRLLWIIGAIGLPLSHYWLIAQVEPFYTFIYCCLWWSYIFVADWLVFRLRGKSILSDRPWEFLVLWLWSVPIWVLFEVVNIRLQNWYYVMAPTNLAVDFAYLVCAFGAVLLGIFETMEIIVGLIEKYAPGGKISGPPFEVHRWNVPIQLLLGAAMLILVFVFPESCFAMAWGFAFLLADPICHRLNRGAKDHVGKSLLGQLAAGDNTRFVALLVAGFICGGLWEGWNLGARTKWIYSVPYFDELKIGEMPILGFVGFLPFALECYALVNLLSYFRGGRSWELNGAENRARPGMRARGIVACTLVMPVAVFLSCAASYSTIASFAAPLDWFFASELGKSGVDALRSRGALQTHQLLKLKERPAEIDPNLWDRLRRLARMAELKGMGLPKALALEELGIITPEALAGQAPESLAARVRAKGPFTREAEAKVWIRAAETMAD